MIDSTPIRGRYAALSDHLDERAKRVFAATEAKTAGYGGIAAVARASVVQGSAHWRWKAGWHRRGTRVQLRMPPCRSS